MQPVLNEQFTYLTEQRPISPISRNFPSSRFYSAFLWVVIRASFNAWRGVFNDQDWAQSSVDVLRVLENVGVKIEISGGKFINESDSPVIFIGNHLSMLETMVLPSIIAPYRPVTFVIKESLLEYPVFKHIMRSRNPVAVSRTNPRQDLKTVLEEGQERLSRGISIIIFPQTTRTAFDPKQFSSIGIKLAKRAGAPVVPLALLTDAWGNGVRLKDFGKIDPSKKVYFSFGETIEVKGKGTDEHQLVVDFIQKHLALWQA
jgi:1-acyl-sn-glycerol-3-phosphate acyltransferase